MKHRLIKTRKSLSDKIWVNTYCIPTDSNSSVSRPSLKNIPASPQGAFVGFVRKPKCEIYDALRVKDNFEKSKIEKVVKNEIGKALAIPQKQCRI